MSEGPLPQPWPWVTEALGQDGGRAEGEHLELMSARQVSRSGRARLGIKEQVGSTVSRDAGRLGWSPPLPLAVWP